MTGAHTIRRYAAAIGWMAITCPYALALNPALDVSLYGHFSWKFRDGFATGDIEAIAQTSDGYLWLGTGYGLLRFDGVKNVGWQPPKGQSLPSTNIRSLVAARDGTLWMGTSNGLASWKNGKITQYPELSGFFVTPVIQDHEGAIWASARDSKGGKLCEIRNGSARCSGESVFGRSPVNLHEDAKGNLWVGTPAGVWRWKPGRPEFYALPFQPDSVRGIVDAEDGGVLISAADSIRRLVDGKLEPAFPLPGPMRGLARQMFRDRDGALWVRTIGEGLLHIHQGRTDRFSEADGMTGDYVNKLFEDREGNMWAATTKGLDRFRDLPVVSYSENQGVPAGPSALVTGKDGSIWFSAGGLYRLNRGQLTVYRQENASVSAHVRQVRGSGLPDRGVVSLFQDSKGRIWASTLEAGIGYLENDRHVRTAAPGGPTTTIGEDAAGNLWIAYPDRGLLKLSPDNEVQLLSWDTFGPNGSGFHVFDPVRGGLWIGFRKGGVGYFLDGRRQASYSAAEGLAPGEVSQVRLDGQNALWVATQGGLSQVKDGRMATLTSRNGLPCDAVLWSLEDDARAIWMGMPCGMVRIARSEWDSWAAARDRDTKAIPMTVLDGSDGARMPSGLGGSSPHADKSPDGRLWFGTSEGIGFVDPRHLPFNKLPPPVQIEQIIADRKTYAAAAKLPALVRDVEIDYTALSFAAPEKNRFRYKLEGHDSGWTDAGSRRQAFYNDLPPRNYRFRVRASNNDGVWNEAGASFDFSVAPAYYQTAWFYGLVAAAVVAVLTGLYRLRLLYLTKQFNANLEGRVSERTRVARDLHDTLLQSFQGVLLKFSTVKYVMRSRPDEAEETLDRLIEQARAAVTEGRDAVQGLRSSTLVANDLARAVTTFGEGLVADHAGGDCPAFRVFVEGKSRDLPPMVRDEVYKVACECLRNAFQHADARRIEVQIRYDQRQFWLQIVDNGKGIDPAVLSAGGRAGHHGLPGLHERAELAGGKLSVWSQVNSGTEIELTIPGAIAYPKAKMTAGATGAGPA